MKSRCLANDRCLASDRYLARSPCLANDRCLSRSGCLQRAMPTITAVVTFDLCYSLVSPASTSEHGEEDAVAHADSWYSI